MTKNLLNELVFRNLIYSPYAKLPWSAPLMLSSTSDCDARSAPALTPAGGRQAKAITE